jgi:tetratricopeptide (TPR) repeat protein
MYNRKLFNMETLIQENTDFAKKLSNSGNLQDLLKENYQKFVESEESAIQFKDTIEKKDLMIFELQFYRKAEVYKQMYGSNSTITNCNNLCELASLCEKMGKYQEALVYYKQAQELNSHQHKKLIQNKLNELQNHDEPALYQAVEQAEKYQTSESNKFALSCYNKLLILKPGNSIYLNNRASTLNLLKYHLQAIKSAKAAIAIDNSFPNPWRHLGNAYFGLQDYQEAYQSYQKALKLNADYKEAWVNLGDVCVMLEKYTDAVYAYQKALTIDSDLSQAEKGINYIISAKKPINFFKMLTDAITFDFPAQVSKVLNNCDKSVAHTPGEYGKNAAHLAAKLGRTECLRILLENDRTLSNSLDRCDQTPLHYAAYHARTACVKLLLKYNAKVNSLCTLNQTPLHNAVLAYESLNNNVDDALDCIYSLLCDHADLYRVNKEGKTARDYALAGKEPWKRVVKYIDQVISERADDLSKQACQFSDKNLHTVAIQKYEEALNLLPNASGLWSDKAYEHNMLGQYQKARECANRAIDLDERFANPWRHLGNTYYALEEYEAALKYYRKALMLRKGNYPEAKQNELDCMDRLNEIELVKLIKSKIEKYYDDLKLKIDRLTIVGITFFYNKPLCEKKLEQANNLINQLSNIKKESAVLKLLTDYIDLDKKLENSFDKEPADFTALLKDIINNIDKLREFIGLDSVYRKSSAYTYSSYSSY